MAHRGLVATDGEIASLHAPPRGASSTPRSSTGQDGYRALLESSGVNRPNGFPEGYPGKLYTQREALDAIEDARAVVDLCRRQVP